MKKLKTEKQLKATLDKLFSEYIRRKHADKNGVVRCVTCNKIDDWREFDAGHYQSRVYLRTRYDERNVFPQCRADNRFHEGKKDDFALFLIRKFGQDILEELNKEKNKVYWNFPYEAKIEEYNAKLKALQQAL